MENQSFKYVSGTFRNPDDAVKYQKDVRARGFSDAFVVGFEGERKISFSEAKELLKTKGQQE